MRPLLLAAALLALCAGAHAQSPPSDDRLGGSGDHTVLITPAPRLGVDLPGLERGAETFGRPSGSVTAAGPRGRAAWRGAKLGFLAGLAVGAAGTAAFALFDPCNPGEDYVCSWHIAAALTVPLMVVTTGSGAAIGVATARTASAPLHAPEQP